MKDEESPSKGGDVAEGKQCCEGQKIPEKDEEKEEKEGKTWEEKWRRDPVGSVVWALILVWVGLALLANNLNLLVRYERLEVTSLIFVGAGLVLLVEVIVRLLVPSYRRPVGGTLILAAVFAGIGLGSALDVSLIGPLVLIAVGLGIVIQGLFRRR